MGINGKKGNRKILIGGAWPYANGGLHLGHIASLLPGDVLARYHRAIGDRVCFVSGSDCHGTPITVRAEEEGVSPAEVASRFHTQFYRDFRRLGFTFDRYTNTTDNYHKDEVKRSFTALIDKGWLVPRTTEQTYCEPCQRFLPDRYVTGTCPSCGDIGARGDQCDACGALLTPVQLEGAKCRFCGSLAAQRPTEHLYFKLAALQERLEEYVKKAGIEGGWRPNALGLTGRYLKEGLVDRAATRDIDWGIDIPLEGYDKKRIYVWFEAVMGYFTATKALFASEGRPDAWRPFWDPEAEDVVAYYVHGKDNIPFHTLIWPALLLALGGLRLPDRIISGEYLTIEGKKLSTSRNWAVWVEDFLSRYEADPLRYFLIANGPEARDADFSWREFVERNNGELLGGFGNFIHRTLTFVHKSFEGRIPGDLKPMDQDKDLIGQGEGLFDRVGDLIEEGRLKDALRTIFDYVRACNKYFDTEQPWVTVKADPDRAASTILTCVKAIGILAQLSNPFLPFTAEAVRNTLAVADPGWKPLEIGSGTAIGPSNAPFKRLDKAIIEDEVARLGK